MKNYTGGKHFKIHLTSTLQFLLNAKNSAGLWQYFSWYYQRLVKRYNKLHNKTVKKSNINEYYFWDTLNISKEEAFNIFSAVWTNWQLYFLMAHEHLKWWSGLWYYKRVCLIEQSRLLTRWTISRWNCLVQAIRR